MLTKILVPTDFSDGATAALAMAAELARLADAELLLLHVRDEYPFTEPDGSGYIPRELYAQQELEVERLLEAQAVPYREQSLRVRTLHIFGAPARQILVVARLEQNDLIVMGAHGHRGFVRLMLGSVSERVSRVATIPVMTVPSSAASASEDAAA